MTASPSFVVFWFGLMGFGRRLAWFVLISGHSRPRSSRSSAGQSMKCLLIVSVAVDATLVGLSWCVYMRRASEISGDTQKTVFAAILVTESEVIPLAAAQQ